MKNTTIKIILTIITLLNNFSLFSQKPTIAIQSDFGPNNHTIPNIKGVIYSVLDKVNIVDVNQQITPFNIWEAAVNLDEAFEYFPPQTYYISYVDPSLVINTVPLLIKTIDNKYIFTKNNGTLSLIKNKLKIDKILKVNTQLIDSNSTLFKNKQNFFRRYYYAYLVSMLAAEKIKFDEMGEIFQGSLELIPFQEVQLSDNSVKGTIIGLENKFGNLWSNISIKQWKDLGVKFNDIFEVKIFENDRIVYSEKIKYVKTYSDVKKGEPLLYINQANRVALALNLDNFSKINEVYFGSTWRIEIKKLN